MAAELIKRARQREAFLLLRQQTFATGRRHAPWTDPLGTSVDRGGLDSPICPAARQTVSRARPSTESRSSLWEWCNGST